MAHRRIRKPARRDPTLWKGAWLAQRRGNRGSEALQVLQDNLNERYPVQFEAARSKASKKSRKSGKEFFVIFSPTMERAYHKHGLGHLREQFEQKHARVLHRSWRTKAGLPPDTIDKRTSTQAFYEKNLWPFSVTSNVHSSRAIAVTVWSTEEHYSVGHIADQKKLLTNEEKAALITSMLRLVDVNSSYAWLGDGDQLSNLKGLGQYNVRESTLHSLRQRGLMAIQRGRFRSADRYRVNRSGLRLARQLWEKLGAYA